jgi:hypothetical protein
MRLAIWTVSAIAVVAFSGAAQRQTKADTPTQPVRISGRALSWEGRPDAVVVVVGRTEDGVVLFDQSVSSDPRGIFTFAGQPGNKYRIYIWQYGVGAKRLVDTSSMKDGDLGDVV